MPGPRCQRLVAAGFLRKAAIPVGLEMLGGQIGDGMGGKLFLFAQESLQPLALGVS